MGVNIGQAAKASGLSERMIRYFEKEGVIPAPPRTDGGYRSYSDDDVRRMRTISLAQDVGFSTEVIRRLVSMMDEAKAEGSRPDEDEALAELERKGQALAELRGRIDAVVDRARARLLDDEPDIDWGPPLAAGADDRPRGITITTVDCGDDVVRGPRPKAGAAGYERDLISAD